MRTHRLQLRAATLALRTAVALCALLGSPASARAQQPVVLVHGINADGSTWQSAADYLRNSLVFNVQNPTLGQADPLAVQAGRLTDAMAANGFGTNTFMVGHSQGGLISRYATELTPAQAVITVGTPHGGAPVAVMGNYFNAVLDEASYDLGTVLVINSWFGDWLPGTSPDWPVNFGRDVAYAWLIGYIIDTGFDWTTAQFLNGQPSLNDLAPGSPFLTDLNSDANVAREAGAVPTRVAFNVQLDGGYWGGPFRLRLGAASSDYLGQLLVSYGWFLEQNAIMDYFSLDWSDPYFPQYVLGLFAAFDLGSIAGSWPNIWCFTTSWNWGCEPSDGVVPTARQYYPGGTNYLVTGPAHTQETSDLRVIQNLDLLLNSIRH
jgi:pimeloyl-ACP methyl ester carboxylesterase